MIEMPYRSELSPALLELWQAAVGERHPITPALWAASVEQDPSFLPEDLIVAGQEGHPVGFALTKRWRGSDPGCKQFRETAYLALMAVAPTLRSQGIGTQLLELAEARHRQSGATRMVIGGSFHHLMPGIPEACAGSRAFFTMRGYVLGNDVYDVRRQTPPTGEGLEPLPAGVNVRPCRPGDEADLMAFLGDVFPGRWTRDVAYFLGQAGDIGRVVGLFEGDRMRGFAHIHPPGSSGTLRWAGFNPHIAALGPIGVHPDLRGKGLGLALLQGALGELAAAKAADVVIDWTDLVAFYGRCGFEPWLTYSLAHKDLS